MAQIEGDEMMTVERYLRGIAGFFILATLALAYFHSRYWLWFTAFVGLNLFQSAFTNWCPMMDIIRRAGAGGGKTLCCTVKPSVTGAEKPK
jgi:hypothetical protein